jgi:hypothetical protein
VSRTNRHPPMQNLSPEDGSHPGHAALVEQGGRAALPDPGRSALPVQLPCAAIWLPPSFPELDQSACLQNRVHPERGLRTQIGGLVQLNFQEV